MPNQPRRAPGTAHPGRPDTAPRRRINEGRGNDPQAIARRGHIDQRRHEVQQWRNDHRSDWDRWTHFRDQDRQEWRAHRAWRSRPDLIWVTNDDYWGETWDSWEDETWYPPVYVEEPIPYPVAMPEYPSDNQQAANWTYQDVANVALNLESITRDMYDQMDAVIDANPNADYRTRLMNTLADLVDASENYSDAVANGSDFTDSLDQLFYLASEVKLAKSTLSGYSKENLVSDDEQALTEYVEELLYVYKANYNN